MSRKIHLKKKKNISFSQLYKRNIIIFIIIMIIISIVILFRFISKRVSPTLMNYAELQAGKIATHVIKQSVNKEVTNNIDVDNLFIINKDSNNNIKTVDFNPLYVNRLLSKVTEVVNEYLTNLESEQFSKLDLSPSISKTFKTSKEGKGLVFEIPSGIVFKNSLLSNVGPKIPIKLTLVGDIDSDIKTKITNYGINNAMIEISVYIHVVEQVILPISTKRIDVEMNIPLALKLIQGDIPEYYLNGINSTTGLSVPVK